jgi:hypothetical protein
LEWQAWQDSRCDGCGHPISESFDPKMDDHYNVTVVACNACAARERKAQILAETGGLPGARFIVTREEDR